MDIDIFSNDFCQNRYYYYEGFRKLGNVTFSKKSNCWMVLGYQEASDVLSNQNNFSSFEFYNDLDPLLFGAKEDSHVQNKHEIRKCNHVLKSKSTTNFIEECQAISRVLINRCIGMIEFDLISDYIIPYSISTSLIVSEVRKSELNVLDANVKEELDMVIERLSKLNEVKLLENFFSSFLNDPNGLPSFLKNNYFKEKYDETVIIKGFNMFTHAGFDSSIGLLSNMFYLLLCNKNIYNSINRDLATQSSNFILESLRYFSPAQITYRIAKKDIEIYNSRISKGDLMAVAIGAANRDTKYFSSPNDFVLNRKAENILTYGKGKHYCIGHHVSQLTAKVALESFFDLIPKLAISKNYKPKFDESLIVMKLSKLDVYLK